MYIPKSVRKRLDKKMVHYITLHYITLYYNILCQLLVQVQSRLKWVHMGSKVDVVNMVMGF